MDRDPGILAPSKLLLRGAVLLADGPTALRAWRSYYHVGEADELPGAIARPAGISSSGKASAAWRRSSNS